VNAVVSTGVVIDITRLLGQYLAGRLPTGVDRVSLAYADHFGHRARAMLRWRGRSSLFSKTASQAVFVALAHWDMAAVADMRRLIARGVLSSLLRGNGRGAFLLHTGHNDIEAVSLWRNIRWHRLRPVFFVHDLIPLTHPQYCRAGEPERHALRLQHMLRGAAVIANSQATLDELAHYTQSSGRLMPPSCVAMLAAAAAFNQSTTKSIANYSISTSEKCRIFFQNTTSSDYYVVVGTIEPRKNHALLLEVWRSLATQADANAVAPHLVVIGQPGWDTDALQAQLSDGAGFAGRVHWVTDCDDAQMVQWLRGARALLFPSFAEGFGMPMAEALALGTPVIASDLAVYREFAGDVPLYLPAGDAAAWLHAVRAYLPESSPERVAQCSRMQALALPTWQQHFAQVDGLLGSLNVAGQSSAAARLKAHAATQHASKVAMQGFSGRKKAILQRYLQALGAPARAASWVWGAAGQGVAEDATAVHVEDGFIRSVGLGADLAVPLSWVFDTRGIYFDASRPSDLELLLQTAHYSAEQLARAARLRQSLVSLGITKYNLGSPTWRRPAWGEGQRSVAQRVVLVAGQVETDASIRLGAHAVHTNVQLLRAVRARCPEAYIVYKPHPDVVAGLRFGGSPAAVGHEAIQGASLADEVLTQGDMAQLLGEVDEVHVITSLTGFEALLRGVSVVVYGAPFYAGWGLTTDVDLPAAVQARRVRQPALGSLTLDGLTAAALIDYPAYLDPRLDVLIAPEDALRVLQRQKEKLSEGMATVLRWRRPLLALWARLQGRF
jgi:glycosyltransferase involved in cell wall biosynthesis